MSAAARAKVAQVAKVAMVVGVGPGLGAAIAKKFALGGFAVAIIARDAEKLSDLKTEINHDGGIAVPFAADITDPDAVVAISDRIKTELGAPEVLIYNAGAFAMKGILELEPAMFEQSWRVNCFGAFLAVQQVLPEMLEKGSGSILFTGATAALRGGAKFASLAVGKFGLRALAQSLAREFGSQGIHVAHIIIDGMINTARVREMVGDRDPATLLDPAAIADAYWQIYQQPPTAWTLEIDLRPATEKF
ncbi:short-chain dehydrogenase/reductase SDR [Thalassoporum mexicanum PCC 7367]|uniref:SDR family NAD(P)-dependent oxidoreductase n=1 Tax=Thalassoporum mexicanum TaxID=3457544 RepID=UPI00029F9BF7|nr:SDR family NAD(P)-dependent oxidoreductase [Pseudanabaena sp. PCC 7367]AFY69052.1 short-chain dehydrogenase/reductase SDR [Pseudanabaena sp. PCC 7367]